MGMLDWFAGRLGPALEHATTARELAQQSQHAHGRVWVGRLKALVEAPSGVSAWNGPYLTKRDLPNDPWGRPYNYRAPGQSGPFDIFSLGADNQVGGTGENEDITNR